VVRSWSVVSPPLRWRARDCQPRRGGGDFDVVTSCLHSRATTSVITELSLPGPVLYDIADTEAVFRWYRELLPALDRNHGHPLGTSVPRRCGGTVPAGPLPVGAGWESPTASPQVSRASAGAYLPLASDSGCVSVSIAWSKCVKTLSMGLPIYGPSELSVRPKDGEPTAHSTS
jgi:hypothetical protein